jgi:hypothetical protein
VRVGSDASFALALRDAGGRGHSGWESVGEAGSVESAGSGLSLGRRLELGQGEATNLKQSYHFLTDLCFELGLRFPRPLRCERRFEAQARSRQHGTWRLSSKKNGNCARFALESASPCIDYSYHLLVSLPPFLPLLPLLPPCPLNSSTPRRLSSTSRPTNAAMASPFVSSWTRRGTEDSLTTYALSCRYRLEKTRLTTPLSHSRRTSLCTLPCAPSLAKSSAEKLTPSPPCLQPPRSHRLPCVRRFARVEGDQEDCHQDSLPLLAHGHRHRD